MQCPSPGTFSVVLLQLSTYLAIPQSTSFLIRASAFEASVAHTMHPSLGIGPLPLECLHAERKQWLNHAYLYQSSIPPESFPSRKINNLPWAERALLLNFGNWRSFGLLLLCWWAIYPYDIFIVLTTHTKITNHKPNCPLSVICYCIIS